MNHLIVCFTQCFVFTADYSTTLQVFCKTVDHGRRELGNPRATADSLLTSSLHRKKKVKQASLKVKKVVMKISRDVVKQLAEAFLQKSSLGNLLVE